MNRPNDQRGAVLLVGLIIVMVAMAAGLLALFGQRMAEVRREIKTNQALAQAKQALLSFASNSVNTTACVNDCRRPGDLPCPEDATSAQPGVAANTCLPNALGRLPWYTLNLPDLRDGNGERLWYARSVRFRTRNRLIAPAGPLNPDTAYGQITVRASDGATFIHQAASPAQNGTGAVAVIIAPGAPLYRNDNLQQVHSVANYWTARHYLDCWGSVGCNVEDNANFVNDSATNGFILGPIRRGNTDYVNDRIVTISRDEMLAGMNRRVAAEVGAGIEAFWNAHGYFPAPAALSNINCLSTANVNASCNGVVVPLSPVAVTFGRVAAAPAPPKQPNQYYWTSVPAGQLLAGDPAGNWFQQNGWREHVFYALAQRCIGENSNCSVAGSYLTVNNPPAAAVAGKQAVIIVGGARVGPQIRANNGDRTTITNYLEDQNWTPLDGIFTVRTSNPAIQFNDVLVTIPR